MQPCLFLIADLPLITHFFLQAIWIPKAESPRTAPATMMTGAAAAPIPAVVAVKTPIAVASVVSAIIAPVIAPNAVKKPALPNLLLLLIKNSSWLIWHFSMPWFIFLLCEHGKRKLS